MIKCVLFEQLVTEFNTQKQNVITEMGHPQALPQTVDYDIVFEEKSMLLLQNPEFNITINVVNNFLLTNESFAHCLFNNSTDVKYLAIT